MSCGSPKLNNHSSISVERAKPEDAAVLAEMLTGAVKRKVAYKDMAWGTDPYTIEELRTRIARGNTYVARLDGVAVGTLLLIWDDKEMWGEQPPIAGYVHQLAVKEGYHGLGLGAQLLDWAGEQVAARGRDLLRIDFPPENAGLKAYYEKLGFTWVKNRETKAPHATYTASLCERPAAR